MHSKTFSILFSIVVIVLAVSIESCNNLQTKALAIQASTDISGPVLTENSSIFIKGGLLETIDYLNGEKRKYDLKSFYIDKNLVTVAEFDAFVKASNYVTEAQRFGNSAVFDFKKGEWVMQDGANYWYPFGPQGEKAKFNHPVTQVSWNDAVAYAKWKGKRLPTAAEWEWAARAAGTSNSIYSWGDEMKEGKVYKANFWQGEFPSYNTAEDGFPTTSPVGQFGATKIGLTDMGGNVWQWTADLIPPTPEEAKQDTSMRYVTKGGSFLCDPEVCHGFKVDGKSSSTSETGMVHTGFRCVTDIR